ASITVSGSNISTISNSEGDFLIKIPIDKQDGSLIISFLGYKDKTISIKDLMQEKNIVYLEPIKNLLKEVVVNAMDANKLFSNVLNNRSKNYGDSSIKMVGFYRESIKKRRTYVSVLESIVDIEKMPFSSAVQDQVDILKGRLNVDYSKLDTINFKLEGGLYTALFIDLIKDPTNIFSENVFDLYNFRFEDITQINDKQVFIISFKQKPALEDPDPLYSGKLFIDTKSLAIISATFQLNVENRIKAGLIFTRKKPKDLVLYPTEVSYQVDYRQQNNKWVFSYSRGDITFKLNWDKWIFNTSYNTTFELVNTNWENQYNQMQMNTQKLSPNVIMSDRIPNAVDVDFWGQYNIIEPEKSIETAIKKIQRKNLKEILLQ
ncbi:MAG: carboxypeptidase-like regulatory domain-containing protein, partial [Chitinophagia bacterium]